MPLSSSLLQRPLFGGLNLTQEDSLHRERKRESTLVKQGWPRSSYVLLQTQLSELDSTCAHRELTKVRCWFFFLRVCANSLLLWFLSVSGGNDVWGHLPWPCAAPWPCASAGVFFFVDSLGGPFLRPREGICAWNQLLERTVSSNASTPACNLCFDRWISITPHWVEFLFLPSSR